MHQQKQQTKQPQQTTKQPTFEELCADPVCIDAVVQDLMKIAQQAEVCGH